MITGLQSSKVVDEFITTGTGTLVDVSIYPMSKFTLIVSSTGIITSWTVFLEGSIDGENFTTIATHTNLVGNNVAVFTGSNSAPCLYFRVRCSALVLGLGTKITATVLGVQ